MSVERNLNEYLQARRRAAISIKKELSELFNGLGENIPSIKVHNGDLPGIIIDIRSIYLTELEAVVLETNGLKRRRGYITVNQELRFGSSDFYEELTITDDDYIKYASEAKGKIIDVAAQAVVRQRGNSFSV